MMVRLILMDILALAWHEVLRALLKSSPIAVTGVDNG